MNKIRALGGLTVATMLLLAACGDDDSEDAEASGTETSEAEAAEGSGACEPGDEVTEESASILNVPDDYETIQAAVDEAQPCDMVLVGPGEYNEEVNVDVENLTIRGTDRNEVILDGEFELDNGFKVFSDGVAIENMTARNYSVNGFFWTGVERYRGSYLTAHNNGDYGVYAFDSTVGLFEHSYGSGSPDAGFYIGQCNPCDAVITDVVSENNGLGYSGTNASGELYIVNSIFRENRAGIVPNSGTYEELYPQEANTIVGNLVYSNNNYDTAAIDSARRAGGNGILVVGGNANVVERNRVFDHDGAGIIVSPIDDEDIEGGYFWPVDNSVAGNVVAGSRQGDLVLADAYTLNRAGQIIIDEIGPDPDAEATNCFGENTYETSDPADIEELFPCDGEAAEDFTFGETFNLIDFALGDNPPSADYRDQPEPEPQENMPEAESAPWSPAGPPPEVDLDAIEVPERPE